MPTEPGVDGASPTPDAAAAPSAEDPSQEQVTEQAPPTTSPPVPDVPFHQHPRWIERQQEIERLRRELDDSKRFAELALQRPVQPVAPSAPPKDPWEGLLNHPDPATAQFWQQQRALADYTRAQAKQEALQELAPVINAGRQELAQIKISDFRRANPEIKPGSEEERMIVSYMNGQMDGVQHTLESAKRNALYDKLETENRVLRNKQASVQSKVAANLSESSSGMPQTAGLPRQPEDWRDRIRETFRKGGDLTEIAQAMGMSRASEGRK